MILMALVAAVCATGCKEDEVLLPTKLSGALADGAVVEDLTVYLSASVSSPDISYDYYIGKTEDALESSGSWVKLEPYTQYFWYAQAAGPSGHYDKTEVRTFYCVPPISVTTDNGDGEYAAVIKWNNGDKFKSVTVSAKANHDGYELEPQTITNGVDSCVFGLKRDSSDPTKNNAFAQYWDDEHGIYAEPVVYDFTVEATTQVGDKTFTLKNNAKECILDKQFVVRDHEYNVYRVVKIGNQTWLADDLRAKSYIDEKGDVVELKEGEDYVYSTLESGSIGVLYDVNRLYWLFDNTSRPDLRGRALPVGYGIPTDEDFLTLEKYYGLAERPKKERYTDRLSGLLWFVVDPVTNPEYNEYYEDEVDVLSQMAGSHDWGFKTAKSTFNAKPYGVYGTRGYSAKGEGVCYYSHYEQDVSLDNKTTIGFMRILNKSHKGMCRQGLGGAWYGDFVSVRGIKVQ